MQLVLSLFPGIDLLGRAFDESGFCVARGPDVIYGGDIRGFHPPVGKFDGVIGGPPCQMFSRLAHMVRQNGYTPKFGNLIPEFERCVSEARPEWFLMEEVPDAPTPVVEGYGVHSFLLNNRQLGEIQNRVRRWSFGHRGERMPLLVDTVVFQRQEFEYAATGGSSRANGLTRGTDPMRPKRGSQMPFNSKSQSAFEEVCRKQGLPEGFDLPGWTVEGKCKAVGNAVPIPMARAMAKAVIETLNL